MSALLNPPILDIICSSNPLGSKSFLLIKPNSIALFILPSIDLCESIWLIISSGCGVEVCPTSSQVIGANCSLIEEYFPISFLNL
jgi:hypothetical protein